MFVAAIPTVGCRSQTCYCGTCCTASRLYKAPVGLDAHVLEAQCLGVRYPPRGDHASIHLKQKQPDTTTGRHVKQLPHEAQRSHQSRTARCQRITFKLQTANELQLQSIALTLTLYKIYIYYIYIYQVPGTSCPTAISALGSKRCPDCAQELPHAVGFRTETRRSSYPLS